MTNAMKDTRRELQKPKDGVKPVVKKRGRPAGGKDTKAAGGGNLVDNPMAGCVETLNSVVVNTDLALAEDVKS